MNKWHSVPPEMLFTHLFYTKLLKRKWVLGVLCGTGLRLTALALVLSAGIIDLYHTWHLFISLLVYLFNIPSAGIIGVHRHACILWSWGWNPEPQMCFAYCAAATAPVCQKKAYGQHCLGALCPNHRWSPSLEGSHGWHRLLCFLAIDHIHLEIRLTNYPITLLPSQLCVWTLISESLC